MPKRFQLHDAYFKKAKTEGFRARSVFKLEEIQDRYKIIKKGEKVLDLGSAPGSFLQSIRNIIGARGWVFGVDLQAIHPFEEKNIIPVQADIENIEVLQKAFQEKKITFFDVITADLSPKTTGRKDIDQYKSVELNEQVLSLAQMFLRREGNLVTKIFTGEDFDDFLRTIKTHFKKVSVYKPKACRDRSKEVYLVCKGFIA